GGTAVCWLNTARMSAMRPSATSRLLGTRSPEGLRVISHLHTLPASWPFHPIAPLHGARGVLDDPDRELLLHLGNPDRPDHSLVAAELQPRRGIDQLLAARVHLEDVTDLHVRVGPGVDVGRRALDLHDRQSRGRDRERTRPR